MRKKGLGYVAVETVENVQGLFLKKYTLNSVSQYLLIDNIPEKFKHYDKCVVTIRERIQGIIYQYSQNDVDVFADRRSECRIEL